MLVLKGGVVRRIAAVLALVGCVAGPALAKELAGVSLPETANVEGRTLHLNGMGVRTKFFFKVYVAGLYLEKPARSGDLAATSEQAKRMELRMLRDVERAKITEAIGEGFQKNSRAQLPSLKARLDRFSAMIPNLRAGDRVVFTYLPGK